MCFESASSRAARGYKSATRFDAARARPLARPSARAMRGRHAGDPGLGAVLVVDPDLAARIDGLDRDEAPLRQRSFVSEPRHTYTTFWLLQ